MDDITSSAVDSGFWFGFGLTSFTQDPPDSSLVIPFHSTTPNPLFPP